MGWNKGYQIMEATVIGAYNLGILDKKLLKVLMEPYRGSDIDPGGKKDLKAKGGLSVEQVVCQVLKIKMPTKPKLPKNKSKWKPEHEKAHEEYVDAMYEAWSEATSRFGW